MNYRNIKAGEKVQEGDQYYGFGSYKWKDFTDEFGEEYTIDHELSRIYRRPITEAEEPEYITISPSEYNELKRKAEAYDQIINVINNTKHE